MINFIEELRWRGMLVFEGAFVEEFRLGRIIASEHHASLPGREISDHAEVIRNRRDAPAVRPREVAGKPPERAVHGHKQIRLADVANPRPLAVPAVRAVVRVAGFGQPVRVPVAFFKEHQQK